MITHPEKVLFPEDGITKGELASYYEAIAPVMLPHPCASAWVLQWPGGGTDGSQGMTYDPHIHRRHTIRWSGWNYSDDGAYFVTVCTDRRAHVFGEVVAGQMRLNDAGAIVADAWRWLSTQYAYVALDEWCVMLNDLHGIVVLTGRGGSRTAATGDTLGSRTPTNDTVRAGPSNRGTMSTPRKPVGRLIGAFKTVSAKHINLLRNTPGATVWQRNFWERIVRDAVEIDRVRAYIRDNPANWAADELNK